MIILRSIEAASLFKLKWLNLRSRIPVIRKMAQQGYNWEAPHKELFGADFKNPVGYSCGVDFNAEHLAGLTLTGASFVEIGTVRPTGASIHELQRLNKIQKSQLHSTLFNKKSSASKGVSGILANLKKTKKNIIIAANISKDAATDNSEAKYDYEKCFSLLYDYVDMFVVNVTGHSAEENHNLQDIDYLGEILDHLLTLRLYYDGYKPILVKIAVDLPRNVVDDIIHYSMRSGIDGIFVGNAISDYSLLVKGADLTERDVQKLPQGARMSGYYLLDKTVELVEHVKKESNGILPIIASGGVSHHAHAQRLMDAGAELIGVTSGFYLEGSYCVKNILRGLYPRKRNVFENTDDASNDSID